MLNPPIKAALYPDSNASSSYLAVILILHVIR